LAGRIVLLSRRRRGKGSPIKVRKGEGAIRRKLQFCLREDRPTSSGGTEKWGKTAARKGEEFAEKESARHLDAGGESKVSSFPTKKPKRRDSTCCREEAIFKKEQRNCHARWGREISSTCLPGKRDEKKELCHRIGKKGRSLSMREVKTRSHGSFPRAGKNGMKGER